MSNPRQRAIKLAVEILGSEAAACERFGALPSELHSWIAGTPPVTALMQALDIILDDPALAARYAVTLRDEEKKTRRATGGR